MRLVETQADVITLDVVLYVLSTILFLKVLCEIDLALHDGFDSVCVEPLDPLAVLPQSGLGVAPGHLIHSESVLLPSVPHALVDPMIRPRVHAEPVLLVVAVLPLVPPPVLPSVHAHALHVVVEPFPLVLAPVQPSVSAHAPYFVLKPVPVVARTVVPSVDTVTVLLTRKVKTLIDAAISPRFLAWTVL